MTTALQPPNPKEITKEQARRLADFIQEGVESWVKAGKMLVQMVDANPNAYTIIQQECPHLSPNVLLAFEKIGRLEVCPWLLLDNSDGAKRLLQLPYKLQNEFYKKKVEVL